MRLKPLTAVLFLLLFPAACSAPGAGLPPLPAAGARAYRLGPGDDLRIVVFDSKQLTGKVLVDGAGQVDLPLIGPVRAAGRTTSGLAAAIAAALRQRRMFTHPAVAVQIASYRPFYILGEVSHPGAYPYRPGMTVLGAVSIAGGFTYRAVKSSAAVIRAVDGHAMKGRALPESAVEPGDVVTVFERRF
ncbi:MAG TPA: polysaccharide biosynthesis/export family protein [Acetobacteraceae bacterium]|nr:polysaccharide biosynthesis/export family protein [Acetobacteraceae bacterium]